MRHAIHRAARGRCRSAHRRDLPFGLR
jgi:hypothetical protein